MRTRPGTRTVRRCNADQCSPLSRRGQVVGRSTAQAGGSKQRWSCVGRFPSTQRCALLVLRGRPSAAELMWNDGSISLDSGDERCRKRLSCVFRRRQVTDASRWNTGRRLNCVFATQDTPASGMPANFGHRALILPHACCRVHLPALRCPHHAGGGDVPISVHPCGASPHARVLHASTRRPTSVSAEAQCWKSCAATCPHACMPAHG